jgi:hypothetical protein
MKMVIRDEMAFLAVWEALTQYVDNQREIEGESDHEDAKLRAAERLLADFNVVMAKVADVVLLP